MRIALPLAKPGMVAVFLFTFLGAWNDFILVRTFIGENAVGLIPAGPRLFFAFSEVQDNQQECRNKERRQNSSRWKLRNH